MSWTESNPVNNNSSLSRSPSHAAYAASSLVLPIFSSPPFCFSFLFSPSTRECHRPAQSLRQFLSSTPVANVVRFIVELPDKVLYCTTSGSVDQKRNCEIIQTSICTVAGARIPSSTFLGRSTRGSRSLSCPMAPIPLSRPLISTLIRPRADIDIDNYTHGYALHDRSTTAHSSAILNPGSSLVSRQTQVVSIPVTYGGLDAGPSPGVVAGIILGSVGGFFLLLYLIYTAVAWNNNRLSVVEEDIVVRRSPSHRRRSREVVEVVRSRSPPRSRHHDRIVVEEPVTTQTEDDVVEVIEEASSVEPPPRRSRRSGGSYRTVDPYEYGGGDAPPRRMRR